MNIVHRRKIKNRKKKKKKFGAIIIFVRKAIEPGKQNQLNK